MRLQDLVSGWMTDRPQTVAPDRPVLEAFAIMCEYGIRHVPVVEGDRLVGIISDRDVWKRGPLVAAATAASDEGRALKVLALRAADIMTRDELQTATPLTTLGEAARAMASTRTSALPVVDDGKLVGIITSHDLLRALTDMPRQVEAPSVAAR